MRTRACSGNFSARTKQVALGESIYGHMRAKFGLDPTAGSKNLSFKFISRYRCTIQPIFAQSYIKKIGYSFRSFGLPA